ncbi:MAG: hypothetical protein HN976_11210 [Lentisphaerae bacterium]|nr:hypothetical protein [Lentisphaerota bacterium]
MGQFERKDFEKAQRLISVFESSYHCFTHIPSELMGIYLRKIGGDQSEIFSFDIDDFLESDGKNLKLEFSLKFDTYDEFKDAYYTIRAFTGQVLYHRERFENMASSICSIMAGGGVEEDIVLKAYAGLSGSFHDQDSIKLIQNLVLNIAADDCERIFDDPQYEPNGERYLNLIYNILNDICSENAAIRKLVDYLKSSFQVE